MARSRKRTGNLFFLYLRARARARSRYYAEIMHSKSDLKFVALSREKHRVARSLIKMAETKYADSREILIHSHRCDVNRFCFGDVSFLSRCSALHGWLLVVRRRFPFAIESRWRKNPKIDNSPGENDEWKHRPRQGRAQASWETNEFFVYVYIAMYIYRATKRWNGAYGTANIENSTT